jgi:hypothetical protein
MTDEQIEALIENSDGHWKEDVFCIGGPELMALLRAASGMQGMEAPSDAELQALWDVACQDTPQKPGWCRHIRFARAVLAAATSPNEGGKGS